MKIRAALLCVLCACATSGTATKTDEAAPKETAPEKDLQRISNMTLLDLASCTPRVVTMPSVASKEALTAALVALNPSFTECLVDPKHRKDPNNDANVKISVTADSTGIAATFTGDATPEGIACFKAVTDKLPKVNAPTPASAEINVSGGNRIVRPGGNDASKIAGAIRIASGQWCDCYAALGTNAPKPVQFDLTVHPRAPNELKGADGSELSKCFTDKASKLQFEVQKDTQVPYQAQFINTLAQQESADTSTEVQFLQLDGIRAQRAADTTLAVATRVIAVTVYDGLVAQYRKSAKSVPMKDLKGKCAELVATDDGLITALEKQLEVDSRVASIAGLLKAKDERWAAAAAGSEKQSTATKVELDNAKKAKEADVKVCPKER